MLRMRMIGPAIAVGAVAAAAASGSTAIAAPKASYSHWAAAQKAAGFPLLRPGTTLGLKPVSPIIVNPCHPGRNPGHKRLVFAVWGRSPLLELVQTDSAHFCGNKLPGLSRLGSYQVGRTTAHLYGVCGRYGQPRCTSRHIGLLLIWTTHRVTHLAFSFNEWRSSLVQFARSLHPVT